MKKDETKIRISAYMGRDLDESKVKSLRSIGNGMYALIDASGDVIGYSNRKK